MTAGAPAAPLVLGAGGMLGRAVAEELESRFPATVSATRAELDVTDRFRLEAEVDRLRPDVIVNCAAYTDVDGCEADPERARRINAEGAENAARAAVLAGCPVLHVSTDFVFDGRKREPYTEADAPAPLSEYGRSKLDGERRVAAAAPAHLIVRTSWLYGPGRGNFVDAIRARARSGAPLRVVSDQFGSPTYVVDLAHAIGRLILVQARGLVHFANLGVCSRHALAQAIVEIEGVGDVPVEAISTGEAARPAVRPARSPLDSGRYARLSGETPRPWREALEDYLLLGGDRVKEA